MGEFEVDLNCFRNWRVLAFVSAILMVVHVPVAIAQTLPVTTQTPIPVPVAPTPLPVPAPVPAPQVGPLPTVYPVEVLGPTRVRGPLQAVCLVTGGSTDCVALSLAQATERLAGYILRSYDGRMASDGRPNFAFPGSSQEVQAQALIDIELRAIDNVEDVVREEIDRSMPLAFERLGDWRSLATSEARRRSNWTQVLRNGTAYSHAFQLGRSFSLLRDIAAGR